MAYSKLTGMLKSAKNTAIIMGLPALVYLINGMSEWMPQDQYMKLAPFLGFISYFLKNYLENKD